MLVACLSRWVYASGIDQRRMMFNPNRLTPDQYREAQAKSIKTRQKRAAFLTNHHGPKIHRFRAEGKTWEEIASYMMLSVNTVRTRHSNWIEAAGIETRTVADATHAAWQMKQHGWTVYDIAAFLDLPYEVVKKRLQRWSQEKDEEYLSGRPEPGL